jgi:hypothetical protein
MTPEELKCLEDVPLDEARSRLEPFKALILRWRRQGRSYRRILRILRDECHVEVAYGPLYRFVQRRSRPRKQAGSDFDLESATVQPVAAKGLSAGERQARLEFVRSLNTKPDVKEEQPKTGWDELEPETVSYQPKGAK